MTIITHHTLELDTPVEWPYRQRMSRPVTLRQRSLFPRAVLAAVVINGLATAASLHAQPRSLRVAPTPRVRIVPSDAPQQFIEILVGATRLPNRQIVVGNRGDHALLLYDSAGRFIRRTARKGAGPGEIPALGFLHRCGDAIYARDLTSGTVHLFSLALMYQRSFRFAELPYRAACNAAGQFVVMSWDAATTPTEGVHRRAVRYWVTQTDSGRGQTLGMLPGSERRGMGPRPLGREPRVAIGADRAYVLLGDSLAVLPFRLDGRALPPFRAASVALPVTDGDVDAEVERTVALVGEKFRRIAEREVRAAPRPSRLPATRDALVDSEGLLWVQAFPAAAVPTVTWTVFAPPGAVVARVMLPTDMTVHEIGRDYLLGERPDPTTGLAVVVLHMVTR